MSMIRKPSRLRCMTPPQLQCSEVVHQVVGLGLWGSGIGALFSIETSKGFGSGSVPRDACFFVLIELL